MRSSGSPGIGDLPVDGPVIYTSAFKHGVAREVIECPSDDQGTEH